jgi:broad specificity phosphatase PhoE
MTELILIRHGETDWNTEGRYQGQSDVPLNARGLLQARDLARTFPPESLDIIFSSDLSRAQQTASILSEATGAPLRLDPRLREIDQGRWEGMLFSDIRTHHARIFEQRRRNPLEVAPPEGETVAEVRKRVLAAVEDIVISHHGQRIAVVSHGLALAIIKVHFYDLAIENVWNYIPGNAEAERITLEAE